MTTATKTWTYPEPINGELLEKVLNRILTSPSNWHQNTWLDAGRRLVDGVKNGQTDVAALVEDDCGTTACLAGWTVMLSPDFIPVVRMNDYAENYIKYTRKDGADFDGFSSEARQALRLTYSQAEHLFYNLGGGRYQDSAERFVTSVREFLEATPM